MATTAVGPTAIAAPRSDSAFDAKTLALVVILVGATLLRVWQLGSVPLGLHNDEAWTGLNAREVLRDGYIGPYLYPSGLGQPAGPIYFTALLFLVLPQNAFTLRLSMALFGIATIVLTYAVGRIMFERTTGLFAAALLAIMPWHLHLSRIAFLVNSWPFIEMAILWVLFRVRQRPTIWGYAAVGALVGLGIYSYNAYALFVPVAAVPFIYDLIAARDRRARRAWLARSGAALLTALWAAALMVHYASRHEEYYWHHRDVSVFNAAAWKEADWSGRAGIFAARAGDWATGVFLGGRPDHGDALGERDHPLLDPLTTTAAAVGVLMALAGLRRAACGVLIAAVLVLPWGALLTVDDGLYRRTFGLVPFIALLAALPLAWLWNRAQAWGRIARVALAGLLLLAIGAAAVRNVSDYFGPLQRGPEVTRVFPYQVDAAARAIARLPRDTVVYFYSDRWGSRFETVRWWAPDMPIVDRSREYREPRQPDAPVDFTAQPSRPTAFVLLGNYLPFVDQLRIRYPGADVEEEGRNSEVLYRIVLVRPG